jgi:single-strand DNA-binding protein
MLNISILQGRLTADPETRNVADDKTVTTLRLAVDRPGPAPRSTDYFTVECWNGVARACGTYLRKGRYVTVQGAFRHDEWTDRSGTRTRDYIVAHHVHFDPAGADRGETEPNGTRQTHSVV